MALTEEAAPRLDVEKEPDAIQAAVSLLDRALAQNAALLDLVEESFERRVS